MIYTRNWSFAWYGREIWCKNDSEKSPVPACSVHVGLMHASRESASVIRQWRGERVVCRTVALWFTCVGVGENYCINLHFPLENF